MDDVYVDEINCPKCNGTVYYRECTNLGCEDGYIDNYEEDPINLAPGEELEECPECHGTGIERWCCECGLDLTPEMLTQLTTLSS